MNLNSEAATEGVLWEKVLLDMMQNSQENTCARVSFLIKFSCEFCEIFKVLCYLQSEKIWVVVVQN